MKINLPVRVARKHDKVFLVVLISKPINIPNFHFSFLRIEMRIIPEFTENQNKIIFPFSFSTLNA